jgi:aldehyde dehydrogenase (NAD+)
VAPDYVLCDRQIQGQLVDALRTEIRRQFGESPLGNESYGNIVNAKHFERLSALLGTGTLAHGGRCNRDALKIEPTLMVDVAWDDPIMQEEIFGPILPILAYESIDDALAQVTRRPKPLAFYLFSEDRASIDAIMGSMQFGGGCVNDTIYHLATSRMRFGGVGASGMGSYHGKAGFETFSHVKSIVDTATWMDLPLRYQPYTALGTRIVRALMR